MRSHRGFTLVELMITVAIVAILTAVAYPAYTNHIVRSKRTAAAAFITSLAARQEQAMLNARAYQTTLAALNAAAPAEVSSNYSIVLTADNAASPPSFAITATPTGTQASRDTKCGALTYNHKGEKGIGGSGTVADCWR